MINKINDENFLLRLEFHKQFFLKNRLHNSMVNFT